MKYEKKEEQLFEIWGKVGFIVQLSQMIEYTLANVLAFNDILREFDDKGSINVFEYNGFVERANCLYKKLEKNPLGFGIKKAKDIGYFETKSQKWLEDVCAEREIMWCIDYLRKIFSLSIWNRIRLSITGDLKK